MNRRIKVAVLGAGNIAGSMSEALAGIKDEVELYAVGSRSLQKAQAFAEKYGYEKAYGSYEELAADAQIDLIYVATPHSEHYENTKLCIEHGRNCIVEKAFCGNKAQAEKLVALAKEKNVFLAEAMWTRYMPSADIIREIIASGEIGKVHYLESDFSVTILNTERLVNPALAGGALLDLGVYSITVPAMYLGTEIAKITTSCEKHETGVDATEIITFTYADGTMARCKASFVDPWSCFARIVGSKGYMEFGPINVPQYIKIFDMNGELIREQKIDIRVNGYEYEILAAKEAILAGEKEAKLMPLSETLRIMGWMDSLRAKWGVQYPFESVQDITHADKETWGNDNVFDDVNPWDRSNTTSYLEVYDIETGERSVLKEFDGVIEAPNWSHNGEFLTYNSNGRVFVYNLSDGNIREIDSKSLNKINNDHVLSEDDSEIAVSDESLDGKSRIYRVPIEGGEPILVTKDAPSYLHGWTPDMKTMCYCAERNGEYDVYSISADGENETRLTTAPKLNDGCEYDSKGEYIYFNSVRAGLMQAFRMKADGSEQTQLTFDDDLNTWFPHISPDRQKIVMISYFKGDLWPGDHVPNKYVKIRYMNADGTGLKTLMDIFGGQGTINVNSWSPDSKKFAFVSYKR